ncbi:F-box domain-containing protein [Xylariales sp. AK1849]|nr:F-box domain-containing protein [Xylariales sp. AK1849]
MEQPPEQIQSELENFREQWRAEVTARSRHTAGSSLQRQPSQAGPSSSRAPPRRTESSTKKAPSRTGGPIHPEEDEEYVQSQTFDEDPARVRGSQLQDEATVVKDKEPETALEFYEKAVDKETSGKLGDSLQLYRKAYRMDNRVDRAYRDKHFPGQWKKKPAAASLPSQPNPSNAPVTVPNTAHHSLDGPTLPLSLPDLIASFSSLSMQGAPPEVEGMPKPPCPIAGLPDEILVHILRDLALLDIGDFVRLSQVCKRLAYLVATESQIWRRVCLGSEFGSGGMVYHWQRGISWEELSPEHELDDESGVPFTMEELQQRRADENESTTLMLHPSIYPSWQGMFRQRPRIRFNGCYISTVNYIRTGHSSGNHITWNSPVHIVTYYRYLRFFRDGTVISLQTTTEPTEVVHHLTKAFVHQHEKNAAPHLPSAIMSRALKGRWRLSSAMDNPDADIADAEGELFVETEGVRPKYMYRMELSLKRAGKARNNKLQWKGFWCYNKLTDDWGVFPLKNDDKAYYFSRVKSYGITGE